MWHRALGNVAQGSSIMAKIAPLIYDMANSAAGSIDLIFVVSPLGSWPALASVSQGITVSTSM